MATKAWISKQKRREALVARFADVRRELNVGTREELVNLLVRRQRIGDLTHRRVVLHAQVHFRIEGVAKPHAGLEIEACDERLEIISPTDRNGYITDGVFNYEIPTDNPGYELAESRIGNAQVAEVATFGGSIS